MIQSAWRRRLMVKAGLAVGAVFVMTVTSAVPYWVVRRSDGVQQQIGNSEQVRLLKYRGRSRPTGTATGCRAFLRPPKEAESSPSSTTSPPRG
jgi:hypothetical protein